MKISTKTRYGLRAMVDLVVNYRGMPVLIKEIARRQNISDKYLEHIMLALKKAGLVESVSGSGGGYFITRDPATITAFDIVKVLEGSLAPVPCIDSDNICGRSARCSVSNLWFRVREAMVGILNSTTLKELAENKNKREIFYHI
ncbi:MAG TPA: Rrf2 family transcriptional regulator [bacterium]|nr:Rrf2 family transcriptional regulator [bacterium]